MKFMLPEDHSGKLTTESVCRLRRGFLLPRPSVAVRCAACSDPKEAQSVWEAAASRNLVFGVWRWLMNGGNMKRSSPANCLISAAVVMRRSN